MFFYFFNYLFVIAYIFLSADSKIAYLYDFLFLNLIIFDTRNTLIATPREGVNGQQYKQIEEAIG